MAWTPRQHPRFRANLAIELRRQGSGTPVRGADRRYLNGWMLPGNHADAADFDRAGYRFVHRGIKFTFLDEEGKRLFNEYLATLSPFGSLATAR